MKTKKKVRILVIIIIAVVLAAVATVCIVYAVRQNTEVVEENTGVAVSSDVNTPILILIYDTEEKPLGIQVLKTSEPEPSETTDTEKSETSESEETSSESEPDKEDDNDKLTIYIIEDGKYMALLGKGCSYEITAEYESKNVVRYITDADESIYRVHIERESL